MCTSRSQNGQVRRMKSIESHSGLYSVFVTRLAGWQRNKEWVLEVIAALLWFLLAIPRAGLWHARQDTLSIIRIHGEKVASTGMVQYDTFFLCMVLKSAGVGYRAFLLPRSTEQGCTSSYPHCFVNT